MIPRHRALNATLGLAALLFLAAASENGDSSPRFQEISQQAGLRFMHQSGSPEKPFILESMSGGVAVFDYDNDGWVDIYLVNGNASIEDLLAGKRPVRNGLFRNLGDGTFEDVTVRAGVPGGNWDMGAVAGDIDNDGWSDLFVTGFGRNTLYRNQGDGTFTDITAAAGLTDPLWSTGAAFADYDRDGWLDLAVSHYVQFDPANPPEKTPLCSYRGIEIQCGPRGLPGTQDYLYRNRGEGKFENVTESAGLVTGNLYYGLGVVWSDYDNDGDPDLFIANDSCPNFLFRNQQGRFTEVALESGIGLNEDGKEQAGMGVDFGDVDGDGRLDAFQTNFSDDKNTLYANRGDYFIDASYRWRLGEVSWQHLGWGAFFFDLDRDGWLDLFVANGHVYPQVDRYQIGTSYNQRNFLFHNQLGKAFKEMGLEAGFQTVSNSRGAAHGDFDNDGLPDVVISHIDGPAELYRNVTATQRPWIGLDLRLSTGAPAVGARVTGKLGDRQIVREVHAGSSYLSCNDTRLLLPAPEPAEWTVRWPKGEIQVLKDLAPNRYHRVEKK